MRLLPPLSLSRRASTVRILRGGCLLLFLLWAIVLALPALAVGALLRWRADKTWDARERWSGIKLLAVLGGVAYAAICRAGHSPLDVLPAVLFACSHLQLSSLARSLAWLWAVHLLLTPMCALILKGLYPPTSQGRVRERRPPAREVSEALAVQVSRAEPLGAFLGGDLYEWAAAGQFCVPPEELRRHIVVLGEPGYGKTVTLLRLGMMAMRYGMQFIYLDLKGSTNTAAQFVAAQFQFGVEQPRIKVYPKEPYDGWRGDARTLYNRLMQMVDPGMHPFYQKLTSSLVALAINAPGGPPVNSRDFLRRLEKDWLYRAYAGKAEERARARRKIYKLVPHLGDLCLTFEGFFDGVGGGLDGGWAFEDGDAIYIGLDGDAQKGQAASMGSYLLEDCAHYARYRKGPRYAFMVIDEFGVLESTNAADLFERVREPGMSICAAAQSYESLGPERKKVIAASSIKILHRCGDPGEIVKFAGEREVPAFTYSLGRASDEVRSAAGDAAARVENATVRMQRQYAMPIEAIQQLAVGSIGLISGGLGAWCRVDAPTFPTDLLEAALAFVNPRPGVSQAPAVVAPVIDETLQQAAEQRRARHEHPEPKQPEAPQAKAAIMHDAAEATGVDASVDF